MQRDWWRNWTILMVISWQSLTRRWSQWWSKVMIWSPMENEDWEKPMCAKFVGKKDKLWPLEITSRQIIWRGLQSLATSVRKLSGQDIVWEIIEDHNTMKTNIILRTRTSMRLHTAANHRNAVNWIECIGGAIKPKINQILQKNTLNTLSTVQRRDVKKAYSLRLKMFYSSLDTIDPINLLRRIIGLTV